MGYRLRVIGYGLVALLLTACGHQAPQRPSQRKSGSGTEVTVDSTTLRLMALNQQLTEAAEEQLTHFAQAQEEPYALYEQGTWVHIYDAGDMQAAVVRDEECTVRMQVYSLSGTFYMDHEQTARIGKKELPAAVEENITEWHHGARMRLLAPWYAAYGIQGTATVPSYENVIIDLEIR